MNRTGLTADTTNRPVASARTAPTVTAIPFSMRDCRGTSPGPMSYRLRPRNHGLLPQIFHLVVAPHSGGGPRGMVDGNRAAVNTRGDCRGRKFGSGSISLGSSSAAHRSSHKHRNSHTVGTTAAGFRQTFGRLRRGAKACQLQSLAAPCFAPDTSRNQLQEPNHLT